MARVGGDVRNGRNEVTRVKGGARDTGAPALRQTENVKSLIGFLLFCGSSHPNL